MVNKPPESIKVLPEDKFKNKIKKYYSMLEFLSNSFNIWLYFFSIILYLQIVYYKTYILNVITPIAKMHHSNYSRLYSVLPMHSTSKKIFFFTLIVTIICSWRNEKEEGEIPD